jgi:hypothetical protein
VREKDVFMEREIIFTEREKQRKKEKKTVYSPFNMVRATIGRGCSHAYMAR